MMFDSSRRLLFFAPHPDDESLAAGGLLQRAAAAGAQVHVVFATNGDDNKWPHRLLERQWKIEVGDRLLWGMRRANEALAALRVLGLPEGCAEFLHLPDQRVTELFLRGQAEVVARLASIIERLQPDLVVAPAPFDLHPDHSALHLLVRLALAHAGLLQVEQLSYAVHTRGYHADWSPWQITLTRREQALKRLAVLQHRSQMALSRNRFLRHVTEVEKFWRASPPQEIDLHHPVRGARREEGVLLLQLERRKRTRTFAQCTLLLALEHGAEKRAERWALPLRRNDGPVQVCHALTGAVLGAAEMRVHGLRAEVRVPLPAAGAPQIFAKLRQPSLFYDVAGWRELPAGAIDPVMAALMSQLLPGLRQVKRTRLRPLKARAAR